MADESPQVEEPKEEPKPEDVQGELDSVLAELKKIGVETPEQVNNLATAASQTGRAWNEVGELRKKVQELEGRSHQTPKEDYDFDGQPIDLRGEMKSVLREYMSEYNEAQQAAYQRMMQERGQIRSDQDYQLVGEVFEKHMSDPEIQFAVNSGQTSATNEYNKMVRSYYRKIAQRTKDALEKAQSMNAGRSKPPHVEKGTASQPKIEEEDEKSEKLKTLRKNWTGGDKDIEAMIDTILPKGDLAGMMGRE